MRARAVAWLALLSLAGCSPKPGAIEGQVFISTKGGQSIKLGAVEVRVFEAPALEAAARRVDVGAGGHITWSVLPVAQRIALTDADGRFRIQVPAGIYCLAAHSQRSVGRETEQYYWLEPVQAKAGETAAVALTQLNASDTDWLIMPLLTP